MIKPVVTLVGTNGLAADSSAALRGSGPASARDRTQAAEGRAAPWTAMVAGTAGNDKCVRRS
jgi:hypothetical protein